MRFFKLVFTLLLIYTVSALLFWGFSLQHQSRIIYDIERRLLVTEVDSIRQPELFHKKLEELDSRLESRQNQYLGEGATLLLILLVGAVIVYTSLQRNVRLQRQQTNFMLAVTHELKSPIAGMKLSLQTLQRHNVSEEQRSHLLQRCIQEADRLSDLCNKMLITSQIEGRQYKPIFESLSLSDLVEEIADLYTARYPSRITTHIKAGYNVRGDKLLLQLAINNLLDNAIKYAPDDSPVGIRLFKNQQEAIIEVSDAGKGIPDDEKNKIFSKFYRIGDEATRKAKGTGLGLYLTKKIVKAHKGKITVSDNDPHGSIFQISLPV